MIPLQRRVIFKWVDNNNGDFATIKVINDGMDELYEIVGDALERHKGNYYLVNPCNYKWIDRKETIGIIKIKHLEVNLGSEYVSNPTK